MSRLPTAEVMSAAGFTPAEQAAFDAAMDADTDVLTPAQVGLIERYYAAAASLGDEHAAGMLVVAGAHALLLGIPVTANRRADQ